MTNRSPTYDHANHMRRLSQTHLDEHDTKLRRRSGSWSGSNTEHLYSPDSSPPRSNSHFLSRFIAPNTDPYHRPLPKCPPEDVGFAYNPSERTAEQLKRKKGPLKGIGSFFRRFRQNSDTLAYSKSDVQEPCTNISDLQTTQQPTHKEECLMHSNMAEQSSPDPWSMETAPERSKRESLQAHLKYFGLDLSSLPTSSGHTTTNLSPISEGRHMESLRTKPHDRFEMARSMAEDMPIQEETEFDIAKSGISSSDASCQTSESMYNTYATSQQKLPYSPVSLKHEFEPNQAHDNDQMVPVEELKDESVDYDHYDDGIMRGDNGNEEYYAHAEGRTDMLTKRLSGGHFGSAGGLVTSVSDFLARPLPSSAKRHSTSSMESVKKEDTVTSFRGERRSSKNSAHTVVGVIVPPLDLPPPPPIRKKSVEPEPDLGADNKIVSLDAEVASINNLKHAIEDLPSPEETVSEVSEESDDKDTEEKNAKLAARRIWVEDETFIKDMERVAEWLGSSKPFHQRTLKLYIEYFDFRQLRLDVAFRKLPLNAETQQIDRILETFAVRYWECNLNSIFGNADVVYAIVYSILLLNTDLHVAQGEHKKMSRSAFIRNTICAIRAQVNMFNDTATRSNPMTQFVGTKMWYSDIESILKEMYTAVKNAQISQPSVTSSKTPSGSTAFDGTSISNFSFSLSNGNPLRRPTTSKISLERTSSPDLTRISGRHARKQMSIRSHSSASNRSRCESVASFQSSSGSYGSSAEPTSVTQYQSIAALITNTNLAASYMSDAPFYKEGVIFGKHLLEIADQKAKGREWKEYFCSVHQAELLIHRMDHRSVDRKAIGKSSNASQSSLSVTDSSFSWQSSTVVVGGGDQRSQSQQMICIDLKHSLSNTLPSGYSRRRPHAFALQQADGGVYVFSVGSDEQVAAWTSTLNYWAARESKEPLIGGVGNMEFGWGECLQDVIGTPDRHKLRPGAKPVNINEWRPPVPPGMSSNLSETEQYANLQRHIESLNKDLDGHREIKAKMSKRFSPRTTAYIKALSNWEAKQQYLLHEIIKYQNYCDAIERALAIQAEAQLIANGSEQVAYIIEIHDPKSYLTAHPKAKLRHIYNSSILNGLSVQFDSIYDAHEAIEDTNIVQIWPVSHFARPMSSSAFQQVPEAAHNLTVQNLAYKNLHHNGSGIRIGVIDSGVDYTHPALGGCFGPGCKVRYGYDLVGDDYNGDITTLRPDQDPLDNCGVGSEGTGHGTHVSGIIAAEDKMLNWTGVAPGATLGMWRVFSCYNVLTPNDILIKAMEMAFNAGMDIINLSLGENGGWSEDPLSIIADRIADAGTHVVVASGDAGASGVFLTAAPASGRKVISTGSIDNHIVAAHILEIKGLKNLAIAYRTADNFPIYNQTRHAITSVAVNFTNRQRNACQTVHANLTNLYVLVERGSCPDSLQAQNLEKAGAAAVILSSLPGQDTAIGLISVGIPVVSVTHEAGQQLLGVISRKQNDGKSKHKPSKNQAEITAKLTTELTVLPVSTGGLISTFSTLGPTNELELKPDITAIGGYVFSTVPAYLGSYGTISGTSMSAPFVSGSIALLLGYNTSLTSKQAMESIMNYAQPVSVQVGNQTLLDSPIRQGSGVVNITASISCINTLSVNPPKLSFNDTEHQENHYTLAITNHQTSQAAVSLRYQNAATVVGFNFTSQATSVPLEPSNFLATSTKTDYAHISFPFNNFTLQPGQTLHVNITITPPSTNNQMHTLYGGYIFVEGGHCTATIPYIGMSGNMRDLRILDRSHGTDTEYSFPSIGNPNNTILQKNETGIYTLNQTYPSVLARLSTGTAIAQIQVQDTSNKILGDVPLQIISNQTSPTPRAWVVRNVGATSTGGTYFKIWKWDFSYLPANATIWGHNSHMSNLRSVRPGIYHLKLRVLRVFGSRSSKHDWEEWLSPPLRIESPNHHRNITQSSAL